MSVSLVLTVIGDDRPGLVEQLATAISQHQGNWLQSSMSNLSGKFAGIVCVSVPETQLEASRRRWPRCPVCASRPRFRRSSRQRRPAIGV
jgi:glycine cleavage system regulatory protein